MGPATGETGCWTAFLIEDEWHLFQERVEDGDGGMVMVVGGQR